MLSRDILQRIFALHLDPMTETAVMEIIRDAVDGKATQILTLQLPGDWPTDYREQFWRRYPRKDDKPVALKKLDKIAFSGKTRWIDLISGLERYLRSDDVKRGFIKMPATFLNKESWGNQYVGNRSEPKSFFDVAAGLLDH